MPFLCNLHDKQCVFFTITVGAVETIHKLREDYDLKIGSTTGFVRSMVDILLEESTKAGYNPDITIAADEVPQVILVNEEIHSCICYATH